METVRKSITFTGQQNDWTKLRAQKGDFTNNSEYIRELVRKDQEAHPKLLDLKNAIDEGLQSGPGTLKIADIIPKVDSGEL